MAARARARRRPRRGRRVAVSQGIPRSVVGCEVARAGRRVGTFSGTRTPRVPQASPVVVVRDRARSALPRAPRARAHACGVPRTQQDAGCVAQGRACVEACCALRVRATPWGSADCRVLSLATPRAPLGRAWEALREDEIACRALGLNTVNIKLSAFAIGAAFGGMAGAFFAARQGFINPKSFEFMESATVLAIVVLGGMGSLTGCAIAAVAMIGGTELLRELDWLKAIFGKDFDPTQYRMLLLGLAMVVLMIWRPRGLVTARDPSIVLNERKAISAAHVKEGAG